MFLNLLLLAPPPADGGGGTSQMISTFVMMGAVIAIFYFMMIRPQQKRAKEHQLLLASVAKGDKVVTSSGMHGTVYEVDEKTVVVTVASNCHITFDKSAIASVNSGN
jgi:preprotein translocase subunit YajC